MLKDYFKLALENLIHKKLRSYLTILGIVIGIAAVVALVSLGQGLQYPVDQQFVKIGADKITVAAKSTFQNGPPGSEVGVMRLTTDDLNVVRRK